MTASQRKTQAENFEHGPLVRIMPWGQEVRWQLPVLMAQAQVRFAKQLHDLLLGEGVTIGHSRVHELVTEASPADGRVAVRPLPGPELQPVRPLAGPWGRRLGASA
jgi:hypothetical protein